jgi:hypothetical protein
MKYAPIKNKTSLDNLPRLLETVGPMIIDCKCLEDQEILPAQALKNGKQAGLHDMTPFLSDEELTKEMIVKIK